MLDYYVDKVFAVICEVMLYFQVPSFLLSYYKLLFDKLLFVNFAQRIIKSNKSVHAFTPALADRNSEISLRIYKCMQCTCPAHLGSEVA